MSGQRTRDKREVRGCVRLAVATIMALCLPLSMFLLTVCGSAKLVPAARAQANADEELVYLDPDGVIKVFDPTVAVGAPEILWQSPTGGWSQIALGDFNADGDTEIAAISRSGTNRLAIFDPVAEGLGPGEADGVINGIPWDLLYEQRLTGPPLLVASGEFDLNSPADEIVYYYAMPDEEIEQDDDPYRFVFIAAGGSPPSGRNWSTLLTHDSGNVWTWIGAGNLNGTGADEVALIDRERGNLSVYTISNGALQRLLRRSDEEKAWQDGDTGQFIAGGDVELAAGRETIFDLPALFVLRYAGGSWADAFAQYFDPPPEDVFMGDIAGNGDDEVIVLRLVPFDKAGRPRLFIRDNGNDAIGMGEPELDADNGYRAGVAGDVDGDGRDEVVVMRNNRIRIYTEPERSSTFADEPATTGSELILAGNLDANGLSGSSRFGASPDSVDDSVVAGTVGPRHVIALTDVVNGRSIPFSFRVEDGSAWVDVTRSSARTPATLDVTLDATDLITGTYSERLIIETSDASVVNAPYPIDISLLVKPGVSLTPRFIVDRQEDCAGGASQAFYDVEIQGTQGAAYTLTLQTPVDWVTVTPSTGTVPDSAELTLDGGKLGSGVGQTALVARAEIAGELAFARTDIVLICAGTGVYLPSVER